MLSKLTRLLLLTATLTLASCGLIVDDRDGCDLYLEFVYDYNMDDEDLFSQQIATIDLYVFDTQDRFLFHMETQCSELEGNNRIMLHNTMGHDTYKVVAVGGLCDDFVLGNTGGTSPLAGETTIEDITLALRRQSATVSNQFQPVWASLITEVKFGGKVSVWTVPMIRYTNDFNVKLVRTLTRDGTAESTSLPHNLEIETPCGAVYAMDGSHLSEECLYYKPYSRVYTITGDVSEWTGSINTCRLYYDRKNEYMLRVRHEVSGRVYWEYNLMTLLEHVRNSTAPGMEMQEYLDRENKWDFEVYYNESNNAFVALGVNVNGWIIWFKSEDL